MSFIGVKLFVAVMVAVITVQGTYLGYVVGVLTSIERRFEISSRKSGSLLSLYDIGHMLSVLFVGYFGSHGHKPRITAFGVVLSAVAMCALSLPVLLFGALSDDESQLASVNYVRDSQCNPNRPDADEWNASNCNQNKETEHVWAFVIVAGAQLLAGIAAAPFNTLAYVYIDDNLTDRRQSPFYLGLLTSMHAFGPAFGFGLSSLMTRIYTNPGNEPESMNINSAQWVGAWWLGFLICGGLYLLCAVPLFFFPKSLLPKAVNEHEIVPLQSQHLNDSEQTDNETVIKRVLHSIQGFPASIWELIKNPVFTSMVIGWMFGSFLVGGYATYLPKYIETQYGRSASAADFYAGIWLPKLELAIKTLDLGIISIGSVAVSTALGGFILTKFNLSPRAAIRCLIASWSIVCVTYLAGMSVGCVQPVISGQMLDERRQLWRFKLPECNAYCQCGQISTFDPVCINAVTYFSPCHAGCTDFDPYSRQWSKCRCPYDYAEYPVQPGLCSNDCGHLPYYLAIMFIGLFIGNLFFMTTMMVVLRCVYDDQKVMALSFASFITNLIGFIPAPIIFGWLIDTACTVWHSRCETDRGNCVVYDNVDFRHKFHVGNASLQLMAVSAIIVCYLISRKRTLPEEEEYVDEQQQVN